VSGGRIVVVVQLSERDLDLIIEVRDALASGAFRRERVQSGLTQAEVAGAARSSADAVALWETGRRVPRTRAALRLGRLYRRLIEPTKVSS
jgi:DNA-binding transcriptional regulator YiaG